MSRTVANILHRALRDPDEPLNILCFPTHERHEIGLAKTGHNFYSFQPVPNTVAAGIKTWNTNYGEIPPNYHILDPADGMNQPPLYVDFDVVFSQNKFGQFQTAYPLSRQLNIPLLSLEITLPLPAWGDDTRNRLRNMRGDVDVFLSDHSVEEWGWLTGTSNRVIRHGIDRSIFKTPATHARKNHILSVVNDWVNRDWCCGFNLYKRVVGDLPTRVVGDTKGLSEPASSIEALVEEYQTSRIFLNTSLLSPTPTVLLEAMSCGCAVVTTDNCAITGIIEDGVNGFNTNDEDEMTARLKELREDEELADRLGEAAVETIKEKFAEQDFLDNWDKAFRDTADCIITKV